MVNYHECFISNLQRWRRERGVTQAQLAKLCNVSNGTIGNIECGTTRPSFDLILKIADKLSIAPGLLFAGTDNEVVALRHCDPARSKGEAISTFAPAFTKGQLERIRSTMQKSIDDTIEAMTGAAGAR